MSSATAGSGASRTNPRGSVRPTTFTVRCDCGATVEVVSAQAGSMVSCPCGAELRVPSLGQLRESAGRDRYESGICDTIHRMIQNGELPSGSQCLVSRQPTDDVVALEILVPRFFSSEDAGHGRTLFLASLFLGLWAPILLAFSKRTVIAEDGATILRLPIRVAQRQHSRVSRMSQQRLRKLLRTTPIYAELLDEHPECVIKGVTIIRQSTNDD